MPDQLSNIMEEADINQLFLETMDVVQKIIGEEALKTIEPITTKITTDFNKELEGKSNINHPHTINDVESLQSELNSKSSLNHNHTWDEVEDKPLEYPSEAHNHEISDVENLQSTLDNKASLNHNHTWDEVEYKPLKYPPKAHIHEIEDISLLDNELERVENNSKDYTNTQLNLRLTNYLTEGETNQLFTEHLKKLLVDKGSISSRSELPDEASNFDSYLIEDEELFVFSYNKTNRLDDEESISQLIWLPLNFFVDMSIYETVEGVDEKIEALEDLIQILEQNKAELNHTHTSTNITDLQTKLDEKSNTNHTHTSANIADLQTKLDEKIDIDDFETSINTKMDKATDITHDQLLQVINNSALITGKKYKITDFKTIYKQPVSNAILEGSVEPIVVTALSNNKLEPIAFSPSNPYDIIYYDVMNNNTAKYEWATATDKGQIYRRITKNGNDLPYDVRVIKFRRWALDPATIANYNSSTTYSVNSLVKYNGAFFINYQQVVGVAPVSGSNNSLSDGWKQICAI